MNPNDDPATDRNPAGSHELLAALREAQSHALSEFERLYTSAVPAIVAWTRLRVAGLPPGRIDVEDIVQETWVRALESFGRYSARSSFRSWAIGIAQNVLLEALRSDARHRRDRGGFDRSSHLNQYPDSVTSVSRAVARDEGFARLVALIFELPTEDRQLILMHGLEERPLAKIAEQLQISEEATAKRWQRLRARLQEQPAFASVLNG